MLVTETDYKTLVLLRFLSLKFVHTYSVTMAMVTTKQYADEMKGDSLWNTAQYQSHLLHKYISWAYENYQLLDTCV